MLTSLSLSLSLCLTSCSQILEMVGQAEQDMASQIATYETMLSNDVINPLGTMLEVSNTIYSQYLHCYKKATRSGESKVFSKNKHSLINNAEHFTIRNRWANFLAGTCGEELASQLSV